jgi:hypothetical protein
VTAAVRPVRQIVQRLGDVYMVRAECRPADLQDFPNRSFARLPTRHLGHLVQCRGQVETAAAWEGPAEYQRLLQRGPGTIESPQLYVHSPNRGQQPRTCFRFVFQLHSEAFDTPVE